MKPLARSLRITSWICRVVAAVILLQTLFFKFTAAPESVYIFERVGLGAPGRIGSGIVELVAAIFLFVPGLTWFGAVLALGVISGAIFSHLTVLGLVVQNDGGELFALALITWIASAIVLVIHRSEIPFLRYLPWIGPFLVRWQ